MRTKLLLVGVAACLTIFAGSAAFAQQNADKSTADADAKKHEDQSEEDAQDGEEAADQDEQEVQERAETEAETRRQSTETTEKSTILNQIGEQSNAGKLRDKLRDSAGKTSMDEAFQRSKKAKKDCEDCGPSQKITLELSGDLKVIGTGKLPAERISSVLRQRSSDVQGCFERTAKTKKIEAGSLTLQMNITRRGRVGQATVQASDFSKVLETCVASRIERWRFPRPKGGEVTTQVVWAVSVQIKGEE